MGHRFQLGGKAAARKKGITPMTDYTEPKKHNQDSSVNGSGLRLTDWDHQPGGSVPRQYRSGATGGDVRLLEANQPSSYERLTDEQKETVQVWIKRELLPARREGDFSSYSLKHIFERLQGSRFVNNGVFKGAMLVAGYRPVNPAELNWRFRYKLVIPDLWKRSVA